MQIKILDNVKYVVFRDYKHFLKDKIEEIEELLGEYRNEEYGHRRYMAKLESMIDDINNTIDFINPRYVILMAPDSNGVMVERNDDTILDLQFIEDTGNGNIDLEQHFSKIDYSNSLDLTGTPLIIKVPEIPENFV